MKIVDANVLIYATDQTSPHHEPAYRWLTGALSSHETIVLPWLCLVAFVRITTHPGLFDQPLTTDQALDQVDAWLAASPTTTDLHIEAQTLAATLRTNLASLNAGGNLTNDAYLAAIAIAAGADLVSFDNDYGRFPGLTWTRPA
jgi:toxin-antitoxin system PIN domain toxin